MIPLPGPMMILAIVLAFVANGFYWHAKGSNGADQRWTAKINQERAEAEAKARATEHHWQQEANNAARLYQTQLAATRRNLDIALDSLRHRPERPASLPAAPRADCEGGTGAELFRADAEFLVREASRADDIRAGLQACYQVIDAVKR